MVYQGDPFFGYHDMTKEQYDAATKIIQDLTRLDRYGISRKKAARIVGAQKKELCILAAHNLYLVNQVGRYGAEISEIDKENSKLNEEIIDLKSRLSDEQEEIALLNNEWNEKHGEIQALKWAFEKLIKYQ